MTFVVVSKLKYLSQKVRVCRRSNGLYDWIKQLVILFLKTTDVDHGLCGTESKRLLSMVGVTGYIFFTLWVEERAMALRTWSNGP